MNKGIFKSLLAKEERSHVTYSGDTEILQALGIDTDSLDKNKLGEVTYFTSLKILSDTMSKLPLKLHQKGEDGATKEVNHYLYNLLKLRPNQYMSSSDFFKAVEFQRNHYGNSVVYIDYSKRGKDKGKIKGLYPLDMSKVKIVVDDKGIIDRDNAIWYIVKGKDNKEYKFKDTEVLHFKTLTTDGIVGLSVLEVLRTTIENAKAGQKYINTYFKSGLFSKGILQYTGDISTENANKLKDKFQKMSGGVSNAGGILPLPLGFSFQALNSTMADSQFLEINELSAKQIAGAFGIKMHMLNDMARSTHTNITEQNRGFYIDTLLPIITMYEQELLYKLMLEKEIEEGYFFKFNVDVILRSTQEDRYESYRTAIQNGFMTPNEARKLEDLPIMEGADELLVNGNMLPIKMAGYFYKDSYGLGGGDNDD